MDKLGVSIDSSLSAANTSNLRRFCLFDGDFFGFSVDFFNCLFFFFYVFLLLTLHRKSQIHDNIMMPVQCGVCVLFLVVEISPVWRGTKQFFTHSINSRVNKRKYWIESNISSCPLTSRLVYQVMQKECRNHSPGFQNSPGPHLTSWMYRATQPWKQLNQVMFLVMYSTVVLSLGLYLPIKSYFSCSCTTFYT